MDDLEHINNTYSKFRAFQNMFWARKRNSPIMMLFINLKKSG
jgi:hypothetical protein